MILMEEDNRPLGDVIAPFVEGDVFVKDFWMKGRVGAMVGASVNEYNHANIILGMMGDGIPRENHVLGPDTDKPWNEDMTSPGDNGWIPAGAEYRFVKGIGEQANYAAWIAAGSPKANKYGKWGTRGLPQAYIEETWKHPLERDFSTFCKEFGLGCSDKKNKERYPGK